MSKRIETEGLEIECQDVAGLPGVPDDEALRSWVLAAVQVGGRAVSGTVTVRLVGALESAELNSRFRDREGPTNVLSFPYAGEAELPLPSGVSAPFGDIVLCAPLVAPEAAERQVSEAAHWTHLVVHSTLHLLGYSHSEVAEQAEMELLEVVALAALGFGDPYTSGEEP